MWLFAVVLCVAVTSSGAQIILKNDQIALEFDKDTLSLLQVADGAGHGRLLKAADVWWQLQLVTARASAVTVTSASPCASRTATQPGSDSLTLKWLGVKVGGGGVVDVAADVHLLEGGGAGVRLRVVPAAGSAPVGLWQWDVVVPHAKLPHASAAVVENIGLGVVRLCGEGVGVCKSFSHDYPRATYQFLATYDTTTSSSGLYVAAHDPKGASKNFALDVSYMDVPAAQTGVTWHDVAEHAVVDGACPVVGHTHTASPQECRLACEGHDRCNAANVGEGRCVLRACPQPDTAVLSPLPGHTALVSDRRGGSAVSSADFTISAQPPAAGLELKGEFVMDYDVVIDVFSGDWWDAAQIYRKWALKSAVWTQKGPIAQRTDSPSWVGDLTTWVNSHWQGLDIFNITGGDPKVVLERVSAIADRFGVGDIGFHWYEWDLLGYSDTTYTNCTSEVTCGFDTHYPEYFPVREGFEDTVKALQKKGVRVAPYINGRIWDQGTESWRSGAGQSAACKGTSPALNPSSLWLYQEQYGSQAKFAVSCPHSPVWQDVIGKVVTRLSQEYTVDAVYIDQIAAAGPRNCWDKSHNHTLGGGSYWTEGYATMLAGARKGAGNDRLLLTESNAEPFLGDLDMFLTLVGFGAPFAGPAKIVPVFPAVYGGYIYSMGAEFFQEDLTVNPNAFAAKIARQYTYGAQMGWFSLGGRDNQSPYMGMYDQLMDAAYDAEIFYLRRLSKMKRVANRWLQNGRMMRAVPLSVNGSASSVEPTVEPNLLHRRGADAHGHACRACAEHGVAFDAVMSAAWLEGSAAAGNYSLMVTVTTVERETPAHITAVLDLASFDYPGAASAVFSVTAIPSGKELGRYPGNAVRVDMQLAARDVTAVEISLQD